MAVQSTEVGHGRTWGAATKEEQDRAEVELMLQVRSEARHECRRALSSKAEVNVPNVAGAHVCSQQQE